MFIIETPNTTCSETLEVCYFSPSTVMDIYVHSVQTTGSDTQMEFHSFANVQSAY